MMKNRMIVQVAVGVISGSCLLFAGPAHGFSNTLFQELATEQVTFPSRTPSGIEIELPNFDELFTRIQTVSPLARVAMMEQQQKQQEEATSGDKKRRRGFDAIEPSWEDSSSLKWKTLESNKRRVVHQIEKIDNFQDKPAPILRFRSTFDGPCIGDPFASYIMDLDQRKKWDVQIDNVYEAYPIHDLDAANIAMGFGKYGYCSRLGVGHCVTKSNLGIDAREQLTLCGINNMDSGACVIWGVEMEEWHDHLFPSNTNRVTRAKSHIFTTTLVPTGIDTFDVEYVIQLEIGGKMPTWLTTPIVIDSVKRCFNTARDFYINKNGELDKYLAEKTPSPLLSGYDDGRHGVVDGHRGYGLLMTP